MTQRKKWMYVGVLLLAAGVLAVDRRLLTDQQPGIAIAVASHDDGHDDSTPVVRKADAPRASAERWIPQIPFPKGLQPFEPDARLRDPFTPPESVLERARAGQTADNRAHRGKNAADKMATDRQAFSAKHRLQGVVTHERLKIAIVDGRWIRLDQVLDGCILTAVTDNEARFTCFDGEATLKVAKERRLTVD